MTAAPPLEVQIWPIDRLVLYARNPRKNDAVVDRMCSSIREFGFKIPVLARSDGEVVDGHLRIKAARKLRIDQIPVILCGEWTPAQVKAFRLMVNRSVNWASWDDELLALELQELNESDFDLSLTGFDPGEIDALLIDPEDDERANAAPPLPESPVSRVGDLWLCGPHRVLWGDSTDQEAAARLLGDRKPLLMVTDPPYGIELDSEWRDRAGLNGCGAAEPSYMKKRTEGHTETTISGDTRSDWSEILSFEETARVLSRLEEPNLLIIETCIATSARISEVLGLQWKHVDLDAGTIKIEQRVWHQDLDRPKTENSRRVLGIGDLVDRYRNKVAEDGAGPDAFVFQQKRASGRPLWDSGVRDALHQAAEAERCDFPGLGPHSFRRANITWRQQVGGSAIEASKIAGHGDLEMTGEYTFVTPERQNELTLRIQKKLADAAGCTCEGTPCAATSKIAPTMKDTPSATTLIQ